MLRHYSAPATSASDNRKRSHSSVCDRIITAWCRGEVPAPGARDGGQSVSPGVRRRLRGRHGVFSLSCESAHISPRSPASGLLLRVGDDAPARRRRVHILRNRGRLAIAAAAAVLPLALLGAGLAGTANAAPKAALPPIKHVWVIELENEGYSQSFGDPAANPYLAKVLPSMGALLKGYYAI